MGGVTSDMAGTGGDTGEEVGICGRGAAETGREAHSAVASNVRAREVSILLAAAAVVVVSKRKLQGTDYQWPALGGAGRRNECRMVVLSVMDKTWMQSELQKFVYCCQDNECRKLKVNDARLQGAFDARVCQQRMTSNTRTWTMVLLRPAQ